MPSFVVYSLQLSCRNISHYLTLWFSMSVWLYFHSFWRKYRFNIRHSFCSFKSACSKTATNGCMALTSLVSHFLFWIPSSYHDSSRHHHCSCCCWYCHHYFPAQMQGSFYSLYASRSDVVQCMLLLTAISQQDDVNTDIFGDIAAWH